MDNICNSKITTNEIKAIFHDYFIPNQFEEFVYDYMANMILEDQPDNEHDLKSLIGDYLSDQLKYGEEKQNKI